MLAHVLTNRFLEPVASLGTVARYTPYVVLGSAAFLSLAFARGRALFAVLTLLPAYFAFDLGLLESENRLVAGTVYGALCIFVPANLAIYALTRERGALNAYGLRRLALIIFECLVVIAVIAESNYLIAQALYWSRHESGIEAKALAMPPIGIVAIAFAFVTAAACAWFRTSVVDAGLAGAIAAFVIACSAPFSPEVFSAYTTTAGIILMFAVLHDSYRMAFHDELTGLPGRRALNQRLMGVMGHYTIAMLDVDHFKSFNDHWGHAVGDQVLKLVASRLRRIERGGTAYRYGGEEFAIVFPGRRLDDVLPALEKLCNAIAAHRFLIRQSRRQRKSQPAPPESPSTEPRKWDHVTVSIGVAESDEHLPTPEDVLKAADRALYRAKSGGRNRVNS
ncbi:MAG TPA: GGDEF domain-containing protein [Burkholderiales bacterium]|nr:GGDEF domain-containing protein [Burkholderiales bacterium]